MMHTGWIYRQTKDYNLQSQCNKASCPSCVILTREVKRMLMATDFSKFSESVALADSE